MVDTDRVILAELEALAPRLEVPSPDWQQVRRRLELRSGRRRHRVAVGLAAAALCSVVAASAAYLSEGGGSAKVVANGELVIDSAPAGVAQLSAVRADGRLATLWRCPPTQFCGSTSGMSWSPDGNQIALVLSAFGRSSPYIGVNLLSLPTHRLTHLSTGEACRPDGGVDWSPDGRWIAVTCDSSRIVLARPTGAGMRVISTPFDHVRSPSWSPDSRRLAFSAGRVDHSAIYVIGVNGLHARRLARGRAPAWSPDSPLIAYRGATNGGSCGGLRLVDADTGRDASPASAANPCHQFGPRQVEAPEWSPDGTEIAIGATSGLFVISANGTDLRRITSHSPYSGRPAWRPVYGLRAIRYGRHRETCSEC